MLLRSENTAAKQFALFNKTTNRCIFCQQQYFPLPNLAPLASLGQYAYELQGALTSLTMATDYSYWKT
jgi:hypothetical protein